MSSRASPLRVSKICVYLAVFVIAIGTFAMSMDATGQEKIVAGVTGVEFNAYIGDDSARGVGSGAWAMAEGKCLCSMVVAALLGPAALNPNPGPSLIGREWGGRSRPDTVMGRIGTNNLYQLKADITGRWIMYPMRA